jgi:homopolymeric O-antigen transport system permease protein
MSTTEHPKAVIHPGPPDLDSNGPADESGPGAAEIVIQPRTGWIAINWIELVRSHELFYTLISRDLKIRYKQTVLGVGWAIIQPLSTMIIFSVIFGRMVGVDSGGVPYPLFLFAGLVPWNFFGAAVGNASNSLLQHQNLLTKIYFPRLYVPAASVGSALVDMGISLSLFAFLMPIYGHIPGWGLLALPLLIVLAFAASLGLGLSLAAATIMYRDLRFVIPFGLQMLMYLSPVIYTFDKISRPLQLVASLNPMFGIINGFRSAILGTPWDLGTLAISTLASAGLLVFGLFFFRKTERLFADIV